MSDLIVAGIDGTGSRTWRRPDGGNSHVYRFVHACPARYAADKRYWHGPDSTLGTDCPGILNQVVRWIMSRVGQGKSIVLVGHSRGGLVAICAARLLQTRGHYQVRFLGLYDAVDMQDGLEGDPISANVDVASHARRSPDIGSRDFFGNCGTRPLPGVDYREAFFRTSHGGIGGCPELRASPDSTADNSLGGQRLVPVPGGVIGVPDARAAEGLHASRQADEWMRRQAHMVGIRIAK